MPSAAFTTSRSFRPPAPAPLAQRWAVDDIIARRRRRLAEEPKNVQRDILTLLLEAQDAATGRGLSEAEVKSNIITFIAAGHETTANALAWSLYLLSQSPEWSERVAAEARRELGPGRPREGAADRLIETRAVVEEPIRLYPPLAAISREAIDRYGYLPFGAGPRICIGATFAPQEATLVLATVMRRLRLRLAPGCAVWPLQRVTLRPRGGLPMRIAARAPPDPPRTLHAKALSALIPLPPRAKRVAGRG